MAVSKRLRYEVLKRDKNTCRNCGRKPPTVALELDHVVPVSLGGSDEPSNLQTLCGDCNSGKASVPADADTVNEVAFDAARWAAAMKQVAEERAAEAEDRLELWGWFNCVWCSEAEEARLINQWHPDGPDVPPDWIDTVAKFLAAGLSKNDLEHLVRVAMHSQAHSKGKWKYFCGCCWTQIRRMQDRAMEILAEEEGDD